MLLMKPKLAKPELTVYDFFCELATLGGFLARKHDGEPGWQSIWTGYKKLHGRIEGMKLLMS
ncbi:MAG: IS4 family transposase [Planctomycetales bacterium]|nr:IS4 family transposase [Planctomycetales bacterium]